MEKLYKYIGIESKKGFKILIEFCQDERPGIANYENNCVGLNQRLVMGQKESISENYLIGVLYHEIGHLKYFRANPISIANFTENYKTDSEYYAFEFSFIELLKIADNGDIEPLKALFKDISYRLKKIRKGNFEDENNSESHINALLKISESNIFNQCDQYLKSLSINLRI